jgi:molybdopterin/thiamine biosynthesis adenylyltransferase
MDDPTLLRYSRHLLLGEIGIPGQERLLAARVLVIGLGGLGCPAATYLAASGVGRLDLVDADRVELTNLQRQVLHTTARIGKPKARSAAGALRALNPGIDLRPIEIRADEASLAGLVPGCAVVLDCSDNLTTRHAVNAACVRHGIPLVTGAASGFSGQLAVFDRRAPGAPCYACLFPPGEGEDEPCATTGVFAPLTGMIGSMMAGEAILLLCGNSPALSARLLSIDARSLQPRQLEIARDPRCPVCSQEESSAPM